MQSGNEIWSVNRILHEKYFDSKIMQKMGQGGKFRLLFVFLKLYIR